MYTEEKCLAWLINLSRWHTMSSLIFVQSPPLHISQIKPLKWRLFITVDKENSANSWTTSRSILNKFVDYRKVNTLEYFWIQEILLTSKFKHNIFEIVLLSTIKWIVLEWIHNWQFFTNVTSAMLNCMISKLQQCISSIIRLLLTISLIDRKIHQNEIRQQDKSLQKEIKTTNDTLPSTDSTTQDSSIDMDSNQKLLEVPELQMEDKGRWQNCYYHTNKTRFSPW